MQDIMEKTVLIIDDNQDDILITKRVLSMTGRKIRTEVALSGEEGLAYLMAERPLPQLVLLDLKMPGMDGIEVLRRIRGDSRLTNIPVIVVTHSALESDMAASFDAGASNFLHKAFDVARFSRDIESLLERWLGGDT